jgi:uncharacterized membrane protein HdeD (DUF308 family)
MVLANLSKHWWLITIRGVLAVLAGLAALIFPEIAVLALIIVFGAYAFVDGIFAFFAAFRLSAGDGGRFWFLFLEGILGVVVGLYVLFAPPASVALSFAIVLAAWAIITGVMAIVTAFTVRAHMPDEWLWVLSGAASVVLGGLIFIFPGAGLLAFAIMFGAYALVAGIALIVLSIRLRKRHLTGAAA